MVAGLVAGFILSQSQPKGEALQDSRRSESKTRKGLVAPTIRELIFF